jgi:hypothetical protein
MWGCKSHTQTRDIASILSILSKRDGTTFKLMGEGMMMMMMRHSPGTRRIYYVLDAACPSTQYTGTEKSEP